MIPGLLSQRSSVPAGVIPQLFTNEELLAASSDLKISLDVTQADLLRRYCELLWDWNSRINLTRHNDLDSFVGRDLLDSHELAQTLSEGATIVDVGSGGGVPGVLLAIIRPDLTVALCESVGKKASALQNIVTQLQLPVRVHGQRVQELLETHTFDLATVRAVAPVSKLVPWFRRHWERYGQLLLVKGPRWKDELADAEEAGVMHRRHAEQIRQWSSPGRDGDSVVLRIC